MRQFNKQIFFWVLFSFLACVCLRQFSCQIVSAKQNVEFFLETEGRYDVMRKEFSALYHVIDQVKRLVPASEKISHPQEIIDIYKVAIRYYVYPVKVSSGWNYFVDLGTYLRLPPQDWSYVDLAAHSRLYARPGHTFLTKTAAEGKYPSAWVMMIFCGVVLATCFQGACLLKLMGWEADFSFRASRYALCYLLGKVMFVGVLWVFMLGGGGLSRTGMLGLWGVLMAGTYLGSLKNTGCKLGKHSRIGRVQWESLLFFVVGLLAFLCVLMIVARPIANWDAMSNWIMKAKVIFYEGTLDFQYTNHNHYPILWPLNVAVFFVLSGGMYDEMALWDSALCFLCGILLLKQSLEFLRLKVREQWMSLGVFVLGFFSYRYLGTASPENFFIVYLIGLLMSLLAWMRGLQEKNLKYTGMVVMMAAALCLTKFEGWATVVLTAFSCLLMSFRKVDDPKAFRKLSFYIFLTVGFQALWMFWVRSQGFYVDFQHFQEILTWKKVFVVSKLLVVKALETNAALVIFFAWMAVTLRGKHQKWSSSQVLLGYISSLLLIFTAVSLYGTPYAEIVRTGFLDAGGRMFWHALPAVFLLWSSLCFRQKEGA